MKGTRPLTVDEIRIVAQQFEGTFAVRNRSLFMLGVSVGGRISELLALTIGDVWQNGKPVSDLLFLKDVVKGKGASRLVPVNRDGQGAVAELIEWHERRFTTIEKERPLFPSRQGCRSVSRGQAHRILETAFVKAGLNGKLATHSLRKSFAQRAYDASGNIYLVQELLGHRDIETTRQYLGVSYTLMQTVVTGMELNERDDRNNIGVLYHSPETISDDTLLLEAIKRGLIDPDAISPQKQKAVAAGGKVVVMDGSRRKRQ